MTVQLSDTVRDAKLDAVETAIGASPTLEIWSGTKPANAAATIARMAAPDIRIVSMTITEGGYFLDAEDRFDPSHAAIAADAANPEAPRTVFGMILAALRQRRQAGMPPWRTVLLGASGMALAAGLMAIVGLGRPRAR